MEIRNDSYREYVTRWINGISSELDYWDGYIRTRGYGNEKEFVEYTALERPFILENELWALETRMIDVGSGPFSICGTKTDRTTLDFTAVDLLAPIYSKLKEKYGLETEVTPEFTILESICSQFGTEKFDIVHMSNSLDHTFNPMSGIFQLVALCKIGGKVILQHHQNEAEAAKYAGLHQWNCTLENGKFEIWNKDIRIDVARELGPCVDIFLERHAPMDTVIMVKKSHVDVPTDEHRFILEEAIITSMQLHIMEEYYKKR